MFIDDDLLGRSGKELLKAGSDLVFGPKGRCAIGVMYLVSRLPVARTSRGPPQIAGGSLARTASVTTPRLR
jgi:hypothetical protein